MSKNNYTTIEFNLSDERVENLRKNLALSIETSLLRFGVENAEQIAEDASESASIQFRRFNFSTEN